MIPKGLYIMQLFTLRLKHNLEFANVTMTQAKMTKIQKAYTKMMDNKFEVKVEFLEGIYDDTVKITGQDAELRSMLRTHFNYTNEKIAQKFPEIS